MKPIPKTLQIFLPEGTPAGIRIAELTTRIVQVVVVPRTRLSSFYERTEAQHIGTYFLFGGDDEESKPISYIGQTEDFRQRLKQHDADKEFWSSVAVLISRTNSFTQAHIRWLEWHSIKAALAANRFRLTNGNSGSEPFVTEPIRADLEEVFETGSLLLQSLGFPIFEPLLAQTPAEPDEEREQWFAAGPGYNAIASFSSSDFVVHKGSKCRKKFTPGAADSPFARKRERLIQEGVIKEQDGDLIFTEDYPFRSPSGAAALVIARHSNGWIEWKNKSGQTLNQVKRTS